MTASSRRGASSGDQEKYSLRFPLKRTSMTALNSLLGEGTHGKVLLFAAFQQLVDLQLAELAHIALERVAERCRRRLGIRVRAAGRLGDDLVDHAEIEQVLRRDLEGLGRALALAGVLPQDRRAALRGNHRVDRILEHQDFV